MRFIFQLIAAGNDILTKEVLSRDTTKAKAIDMGIVLLETFEAVPPNHATFPGSDPQSMYEVVLELWVYPNPYAAKRKEWANHVCTLKPIGG